MSKKLAVKVTKAVQAWQHLSISQREKWEIIAHGTTLTGFTQFLNAYLRKQKEQ